MSRLSNRLRVYTLVVTTFKTPRLRVGLWIVVSASSRFSPNLWKPVCVRQTTILKIRYVANPPVS